MSEIIYISGQKIGSLFFIERVPRGTDKKSRKAKFKCSCGEEFITRIDAVKEGRTKSCGCSTTLLINKHRIKHGHIINGKTPEYVSWQSMWARVTNVNHKHFHYYKELNISICDEWKDFRVFIKDMGLMPDKAHTLERIENKKGYYKENCKWATRKEQARNKRDTTFAEYQGEKKSIAEWAELIGLTLPTLYGRIIQAKWSVEKAFTTPSKGVHPIKYKNIST